MIEILAKHNASIGIKNYDGSTALHTAAALGHSKTVEALINNGANLNAKDRMGKTPLHNAAFLGNLNFWTITQSELQIEIE